MEPKTLTFQTKIEQLMYNNDDVGEAFSAVSQNPTFIWAKFILTDDKPNANKQRIPKEEYASIIKTGIHTPVKMGFDGAREDHDEAFPLGVVTNLKEEDDKIIGLAALWTREREKDVQALREMYANGNLPQLSWEMLYQDSKVDENGVENLLGTSLRAVTVVSLPAYAGRTPMFAFASKNKSISEEEKVTIEELQAKLTEVEASLTAKDTLITEKESALSAMQKELDELKLYKETVEKEKKASERMVEIQKKFSDAGIQKDETFFTEKKDFLLGLDEATLDFMVQEMVSFASQAKEGKSSTKVEVPDLKNTEGISSDPKVLAEELRKRIKK